jgi:hypothetical protein
MGSNYGTEDAMTCSVKNSSDEPEAGGLPLEG